MVDRELLQHLQDLGLTEYQSRAYVAAVGAGEARPSELVDDSGVPQGRIYGVIDDLEELGLVEVRSGSQGKVVSAPSPQTVLADLKRRRIDDLSDSISAATSELEQRHRRTDTDRNDFVSMVKRDETAKRHAKQAIEAAEYWLTVCIPDSLYGELESYLREAVDRGTTVRLLLTGTDPAEVDFDLDDRFRIRYREAADTFVVADRTYGIFSSKHPAQDRQPYIITQEPNLVLLFQNYGQQVWNASRVVQEVSTFPRRYLDPWRAISELGELLDGDADLVAIVDGRRTDSRERRTWEGPIVAHEIGGPAEIDYTNSPPTFASLTLETDDGTVTVGGWKATFEDIAARGIEVR
jgi:sugar-specific transcriptional regulator TrmB